MLKKLLRLNVRSKVFRNFSDRAKVLIDDSHIQVANSSPVPVVTKLNIADAAATPISAFRVIDLEGKVLPDAPEIKYDEAHIKKMYNVIGRLQCYDDVMYNAQRQGRISFYMQCAGIFDFHSLFLNVADDVCVKERRQQSSEAQPLYQIMTWCLPSTVRFEHHNCCWFTTVAVHCFSGS